MSGAETQVDITPVEWQGKSYKALADGKYDVIICGTGLKECILSGLLSKKGMKASIPVSCHSAVRIPEVMLSCRSYTLTGTATTAATVQV